MYGTCYQSVVELLLNDGTCVSKLAKPFLDANSCLKPWNTAWGLLVRMPWKPTVTDRAELPCNTRGHIGQPQDLPCDQGLCKQKGDRGL